MSRRQPVPCQNCPFRSDIKFYLAEAKVQSIVRALLRDGDFCCHNTTVATGQSVDKRRACMGAAIFLEHVREGGVRANRTFRLREVALHEFRRDELNLDAPVFKDVESFVAARAEDDNGYGRQ